MVTKRTRSNIGSTVKERIRRDIKIWREQCLERERPSCAEERIMITQLNSGTSATRHRVQKQSKYDRNLRGCTLLSERLPNEDGTLFGILPEPAAIDTIVCLLHWQGSMKVEGKTRDGC